MAGTQRRQLIVQVALLCARLWHVSTQSDATPASPAEASLRRRASVLAAVVAGVVFLGALLLLAIYGTGADLNGPVTKTTSSTKTVPTAAGKPIVTMTHAHESTDPAPDRSLLGRAFGTGAAPIVLQILLAGVAAFASGALVQRVMLGEYGITLGPVSLPALPPVSVEAAEKAVDLIRESPEFAEILGPGPRGPQPFPQFMQIEDDRLALISIRIEVEERLRALASAVGIDRDVSLTRLPARLVTANILDNQAAMGLRQLFEIGDRVAAGAEIDAAASQKLRDQAFDVLYALGELTRRASEKELGE